MVGGAIGKTLSLVRETPPSPIRPIYVGYYPIKWDNKDKLQLIEPRCWKNPTISLAKTAMLHQRTGYRMLTKRGNARVETTITMSFRFLQTVGLGLY